MDAITNIDLTTKTCLNIYSINKNKIQLNQKNFRWTILEPYS